MGSEAKRGQVSVVHGNAPGHDLKILIAVTGALEGLMAHASDASVACSMANALMGEEFTELDELVLSGVAEVCNAISGRAMARLADLGLKTRIVPPVMLLGHDTRISILNISRQLVPIDMTFGTIERHIALKPMTAPRFKSPAVA